MSVVQRGSHRLDITFSERSVALREQGGTLFDPASRSLRRLDIASRDRSLAYRLRILS